MLTDPQLKALVEAVASALETNHGARIAIVVAEEGDVQRVFASAAERMLALVSTSIANVNRSALTITVRQGGRIPMSKDPSVRVVRPESALIGARLDHVFHAPEIDTHSPWFKATISGRLTKESILAPFPAPLAA